MVEMVWKDIQTFCHISVYVYCVRKCFMYIIFILQEKTEQLGTCNKSMVSMLQELEPK